ncbi:MULTISPECIES: TonB-dependent siderophore receptor [unclassified Rhodanobacter]|uniref:TonB-dependent receptor plug domain-containing protein n=1 Tax=unclassified Rhodanobacter TaxID=2621553 RepID=UPI001F23714E|nr:MULTISPECIES: TonB-dependent receptor [unclassified Rhodanobacter]
MFELGTIVVSGAQLDGHAPSENVVTRQDIERYNRNTVGDAVNTTAGVNLSHNSRNEDIVYVRGFDVRQVPVFLDGIPQYVPYDGYIDFGRFTTFDLAEIRVAKGAASLLYGPNIMGGAINLVTRKPVKAFEGDARVGVGSGSERQVAANVGSNQGSWYFQAGASWLDADNFPLGNGFRDKKKVPTDTGGHRENADRTDKRVSFKIGLTPNDTDEYALGYVKQDGEKGNPVYAGDVKSGIRYWRWPYWDKESLYFISNTQLGADHALKFRLYGDKYSNGLDAYTDGTYAQQLNNQSFPSYYADKTRGASAELVSNLDRHELHVAVHYKEDIHVESNPSSPTKRYRDVTVSAAVEDIITLADATRLRLGAGYDQREAREVYYWPTGKTHTTNGLAELTHNLSDNGQVFFSVARKSRFPTIKDRYSARMGTALPNPDLKPEQASHVELGWRGTPWTGAWLETALFYSHINNLIQNNLVLSDACSGITCNQAQNIGKARHRGAEVSLEQRLGEQWRIGVNYTYLNRDNLSNHAVPLLDTPTNKLFAHASWNPSEQWEIVATLDAESGRRVSYAGSSALYRGLSGFATTGAKVVWKPRRDLALEAGGRNLGDKNYELSDGFPMPGRTWFANAHYSF